MNTAAEKNERDPNVIKSECLSFLEKKYSETFVSDTLQPQSWAYQYDLLYVHPKSDTTKSVKVYHTLVNGKYVITDNYVGLLVQSGYEDLIHNIATQYFGECKVSADIDNRDFPNKYGAKTAVSQLVAKEKISGDVSIFVKYDENSNSFTDKVANQFEHQMLENRLYGDTWVFKMKNSKYEQLDMNDLKQISDSPSEWYSDVIKFFIGTNLRSKSDWKATSSASAMRKTTLISTYVPEKAASAHGLLNKVASLLHVES